ncbi:MAG: FlgD immunoglobulin-like domain containing protein, partial [bacterium]
LRLTLAQCYPNPFNPTTRIEFETPQAGRVQLVIFNVKGEVVARVVDELLPAGRHTATWDGRTTAGRPAASGVYFYRLAMARAPSLTRKMVLLR